MQPNAPHFFFTLWQLGQVQFGCRSLTVGVGTRNDKLSRVLKNEPFDQAAWILIGTSAATGLSIWSASSMRSMNSFHEQKLQCNGIQIQIIQKLADPCVSPLPTCNHIHSKCERMQIQLLHSKMRIWKSREDHGDAHNGLRFVHLVKNQIH